MTGHEDPSRCKACQLRDRAVGLLCAACSEALATTTLLPEQIIVREACDSEAVLLDPWGRGHPLATKTSIGRSLATSGLAILHASVSREHARIERAHGVWTVFDAGSSNGTFVNHDRVTERALAHGDRIVFGGVGVYAVFDIGRVDHIPDPAVVTSLAQPLANRACLGAGRLVPAPLRIIEPPRGGGTGLVELSEATARLSAIQLRLVELLVQRMRDDKHLPDSARGFVRSSELVRTLAWDRSDPEEIHVKQLVRRTRRSLIRSGLGNLIESRHRFGYRLSVIPI